MPFRIDETDSQVLIVHTGDHIGPDDYEDFLKYWASRFEGEERFGIMLVNEPHTHDEEGDEELSEEELKKIREERGARLIRIINDFRRDYRQRSNQKTIGMANVYPADAEWIQELGEDGWEDMQTKAMMRSNYMFGIRGRNFTDIEEAKAWIKEQASQPPIALADDPQASTAVGGRIGLFYGSTTGVTEDVADQIADVWSETGLDALEAVNISYLDDISTLKEFDYLILGCPTWNVGELQDDWELELPNLENVDFS
ncbi:MAG: flavodoxin domain-containing protein, partial [Bacteroidota bacterium]